MMPKFLLILIPIALTACGANQSSSLTTYEDPQTNTKTFITTDEEIKLREDIDLEKQKNLSKDIKDFTFGNIKCQDNDCPESVGGLYIRTALSHGRFLYNNCSGTLIDNKHFLTNKHCLTKELQKLNADCSGRIKIVLPATKNNSEVNVGCKKITSITSNDLDVATIPDWAVLELSLPVNRDTPGKLSTTISTTDKVVLYPVFWDNPIESEVGTIRKVTCNLKQEISPASDVAQLDFENCDKKLIQGNSGTGVFSMAKQIIGLMSHIITSAQTHSGRGTNITFIN